jgi:hypothetical protein
MKLYQATDTCETVAEQLVRDLEVARKLADNVDPLFGYQVEIFKRDAVKLKNDLVILAGAARRKAK